MYMQLYKKTPLIDMTSIDHQDQVVKLKMEAYQPSGSFKIRGVEHMCRWAIDQGATRLVSSSGGNAGLSVAYVGKKLDIPVIVVVPKTTSNETVDKLKKEKAEVIIHGEVWDEADRYARSILNEKNSAYIPPFDHPKLWEGHATLIDELKEECESQPDLIILSVGGGGLLNGVMEGLIRNQWTDTQVLAVETEGAGSFYASYKADQLKTLDKIDTIATSLGAKRVSEKALDNVRKYKITPCLVTDKAATNACVRFADEYRTIVEPACGASLSVIYDHSKILEKLRNIVVIVCGGSNVNLKKLMQWKKYVTEVES
jgi:L-serine/L-threonine ammonia-lyase